MLLQIKDIPKAGTALLEKEVETPRTKDEPRRDIPDPRAKRTAGPTTIGSYILFCRQTNPLEETEGIPGYTSNGLVIAVYVLPDRIRRDRVLNPLAIPIWRDAFYFSFPGIETKALDTEYRMETPNINPDSQKERFGGKRYFYIPEPEAKFDMIGDAIRRLKPKEEKRI